MMRVAEIPTPAPVIDAEALARNLTTMSAALPGPRLRPHVKATKCTALAREQDARGHTNFTCATSAEVVGMARAGLGTDLLLANETVDDTRLRAMAECGARVTVAVDSAETIQLAAANGIAEVLIDVNVGMPRCGCAPEDAGPLADAARARDLHVRGVMGYEGHVVGLPDRSARVEQTAKAMELLAVAYAAVGGDVISAGGTGTYDINTYATEIQAGSYSLMDGAYAELGLPFVRAFAIVATVIHVSPTYAVADCGLKALAMDHGNPSMHDARVLFCSDEHVTFVPEATQHVGDKVFVWPAHVDPTVALHQRLYLSEAIDAEAKVIDGWRVDLRGWNVDR
jgi:D-serine deaminase-like pyridoxal phosphate-dependent protein